MNIPDIKYNILLNTDIDYLSTLCQVDRQYNAICSNIEFWYNYFDYHQIKLPPYEYYTSRDWIKAFKIMPAVKNYLNYNKLSFEGKKYIEEIKSYIEINFNHKSKPRNYCSDYDKYEIDIFNNQQWYVFTISIFNKNLYFCYQKQFKISKDELEQILYDLMFSYDVK